MIPLLEIMVAQHIYYTTGLKQIGIALSGSGLYDYGSRLFTIEARVSGDQSGVLSYTRDDNDGGNSVTGEYGGEMIDLEE